MTTGIDMFEYIQIHASEVASMFMNTLSGREREKVSEKVDKELRQFIDPDIVHKKSVACLCSTIAEFFPDNIVVTSLEMYPGLMLFIDVLPLELSSKFVYTTQPTRIQ